MIYERPDQAVLKPESNLTWVREREVDAKVKMRESDLCLDNPLLPTDSRSCISINFKEKGKSVKNRESVRGEASPEQGKEWDELKESDNMKKQLLKGMS